MHRFRSWVAAAATLLVTSAVHAATFTVTRADDPGPDGCAPADCSLREAVLDANATQALDEVVLAAATYVLSPGTADELFVTAPLALTGAGSAATIIEADTGGLHLVFRPGAAGSTVEGATFRYDGVQVQSGSAVTFRLCRFDGQNALALDNAGTSTVEESTFDGFGALIAGIRNSAAGDLTIRRSTLDGSASGGPSLVNAGVAAIESSTFHEGSAFPPGPVIQNTGALDVTSSTIAGPTGPFAAPALSNGGTVSLLDTIVRMGCSGSAVVDGGGNLEGPGDTCGLTEASSQVGIADLGLAGLADNGGPTRTRALLAGSPAIGAGVPGTCPSTDQRGEPRGATCDAGAFELVPGCASVGGSGSGTGLAVGLLLGLHAVSRRQRTRRSAAAAAG